MPHRITRRSHLYSMLVRAEQQSLCSSLVLLYLVDAGCAAFVPIPQTGTQRRWERSDRLDCSEPLFEERIEVIWDKGSSGLVFHTDAARVDGDRGDFDEVHALSLHAIQPWTIGADGTGASLSRDAWTPSPIIITIADVFATRPLSPPGHEGCFGLRKRRRDGTVRL